MKHQSLKYSLIFIVLWSISTYLLGSLDHLHNKPCGVHQGAQCDRASLAQNFFYGGMHLSTPEVNENRCIDGIVSCEFPIVSFTAAGLYKCFGYDETWFRLLSYLLFSIGALALFLLFKRWLNTLLSFVLVMLIQAAPVMLFYSANFLPDIAALGLALSAWYFIFLVYIPHPFRPNINHWKYKMGIVICLGLSIAIKTTIMIQWLTLFGVFITQLIWPKTIILQHKKSFAGLLLASLILPIAWYMWSRHLAAAHNSQYFLMSLPQSESLERYWEAWAVYLANWPEQLLSYPLVQIAACLLVLTSFIKPWANQSLWRISMINTWGSIAFLCLMMEQFKYHDYYIICLAPALVFNWLCLSEMIARLSSKWWWVKVLCFMGAVLACNLQFNRGRLNLEERYTPGNYWEQSHQNAHQYDSLRPALFAHGIDRNACVVVGYDPSPNNILYLLHLRGHRLSKDHDQERVEYVLYGAHPKYLISNDRGLDSLIDRKVKGMRLLIDHQALKVFELSYTDSMVLHH